MPGVGQLGLLLRFGVIAASVWTLDVDRNAARPAPRTRSS
jgi:hypothetical protein